jgi:hypothetical protein
MHFFSDRPLKAFAVAALMSFAVYGRASDVSQADAVSAAQTTGTWQEHHYSFVFMGFTSTYSCDGLADKLKTLLLAAGARGDAKSRAGACASGFGRPDQFARADLVFYTLSPGLAASADSTANTTSSAPVAAAWHPVAWSSHHPRDLRTGDCELVEQFKSNLLPMFVTRNVDSHTTCIPHQDSGSNIDLKFESLAAAPQTQGKPSLN